MSSRLRSTKPWRACQPPSTRPERMNISRATSLAESVPTLASVAGRSATSVIP